MCRQSSASDGRKYGAQSGQRLEHGDVLSADLMSRVKALGIVVVQNPLHFMLTDLLTARLGPQRMAAIQPMKSLLDHGIPLAIGADGP